MKKAVKFALIQTVPVLLGYLFLGIAFGILLQKAGLGVFWAFLINALVYAGSMQFALAGIDFAMTALFVVICVEQWEAAKTHLPALISFVCGILFLALIRSSNFILPALICGAAALILFRPIIEKRMEVPRS